MTILEGYKRPTVLQSFLPNQICKVYADTFKVDVYPNLQNDFDSYVTVLE